MESLLPIYYFIIDLGKSIRLSEKILCRCDVLSVTSCHWSTFQISAVSQQTFLDQLPPGGPSASLSIVYSVHQCYFLDLHLDMLANWSWTNGVSSKRDAVTKFAQVSTDNPAHSGCSSVLWYHLSFPKLNYLSAVEHLLYCTGCCVQWILCWCVYFQHDLTMVYKPHIFSPPPCHSYINIFFLPDHSHHYLTVLTPYQHQSQLCNLINHVEAHV